MNGFRLVRNTRWDTDSSDRVGFAIFKRPELVDSLIKRERERERESESEGEGGLGGECGVSKEWSSNGREGETVKNLCTISTAWSLEGFLDPTMNNMVIKVVCI